jgi:hypothetical protein
LVGASTPAFAATSAVNASTVSPTLVISVTVQKAIGLTLSQGASGGACAVTTASDYSMSFGNVDALGINTPTCGAKFDPTTPGSSPSAYYTDYKLTPSFTNQASTTAAVTAYVSTNFATLSNILAVVQASSAPGAIGTAITRYIGVTVQPTNSSSVTVSGSDTATITYTMTVP